MSRTRASRPATAALAACGVFGAALSAAALVVPLLPADPPQPRVNLDARARLAALDSFDTRALPAALVFDPLRKTSAVEVLPALTLTVPPGLRPDPQPLRVLHNGRFSLPAGDYRVDADFGPNGLAAADALSLQVGRVGSPLLAWTVPAAAPALRETFHLPVDASFVGFRGSRALEQALQSLTITPLAITNAGERVHSPTVLGATQYGQVMVLLHDDKVTSGADGILGARPAPHRSQRFVSAGRHQPDDPANSQRRR